MFDCETLPIDNEDLGAVQVDLPRLQDDSANSSPLEIESVLAYLKLEAPGGDRLTSADLRFERTVDLVDAEYWVWSFPEPDGGARAYVAVRQDASGTLRTYDTDYYGLSPVQFVVGEYCGCW